MNLETYLPFYWTAISNRWTADSSRLYLARFNIGVAEWRVIATLGGGYPATALESGRLSAMDKAAVSRAVGQLRSKGLLGADAVGEPARRGQPLKLTEAGHRLFEEVKTVALTREADALADLTPGERKTLVLLLRRVYARLVGDLPGTAPPAETASTPRSRKTPTRR